MKIGNSLLHNPRPSFYFTWKWWVKIKKNLLQTCHKQKRDISSTIVQRPSWIQVQPIAFQDRFVDHLQKEDTWMVFVWPCFLYWSCKWQKWWKIRDSIFISYKHLLKVDFFIEVIVLVFSKGDWLFYQGACYEASLDI